MNKSISIVFLAVILTGCAQTRLESLSAINGLTFSYNEKGDELVEKYTVIKSVPHDNKGSIHTCAALAVNNKSVSLSDDGNSFIGAYWWGRNFGFGYRTSNTFTVEGGETVKYTDKNSIIVEGVTDYSGMGSTMYARYNALISRDGDDIHYLFTHIEQAQKYTGGLVNKGFYPVTTWKEAGADRVIAALNNEVEKIHNCLLSN